MWEPALALALLLGPHFISLGTQVDQQQESVTQQTPGRPSRVVADPALTLEAAIRAGDAAAVARLLNAGADPNSRDVLGGTPLLTASWLGNASVVSLLLSHGADANAIHREAGASALEYAVLKGRADIVQSLLAAGADVEKKYRGGQTVLHLAAARTSVTVLDQLIAARGNLAATDDLGNTPLDDAVLHNRPECVRSLLDHGASLHYLHPADGRGALHEASVKGYAPIVNLLISRGADPALRDRSGQTPLDLALDYKNAAVVALLLKLGRTISGSQASGEQAMESAALKNQKKVAQLFLNRGANVGALNRTGGTPLHDAALGGSVDVINELLEHGANIDAQDRESGATPLMLAVSMDRLSAARLLLTKGANPRITDHLGNTALDRALKIDDPDLVKLLRHPAASGS
jgi:uncharacterized protein